MRAAVLLPVGYHEDPNRLYPVNYVIGGFGSDHHMIRWMQGRWDEARQGLETALALHPHQAGLHLQMAEVLDRLGQPEAAGRHRLTAERLIEQAPTVHGQGGHP